MAKELAKEELLDKIEKDAAHYEHNWKGCARSVMRALRENMDLGNEQTVVASSILCGGIGGVGENCGALTGGVMGISLAMGDRGATADNPDDEEAFFRTLAAGHLFWLKFIKEFGSSFCRHIQTNCVGELYNLTDRDQYKKVSAAGIYNKAPEIVGKAARMAAEFILEQREKDWEDAQKASIYFPH